MSDWWNENADLVGIAIVLLIIVGITVWFILAITVTLPVTGTITKLYNSSSGGFATVRLSDSTEQTVEMSLLNYGLLSEGETCTFQVTQFRFANSMQCETQKR